jgi:hypothetical protein
MTRKPINMVMPDPLNATTSQTEAFIDHLAMRSDELLADVKAALRGELTFERAHQMVADALTFNSIASQLSVIAHTVAIRRLKS